jgi:hypothetical protein
MRDSFAAFYDPYIAYKYRRKNKLHVNKLIIALVIALTILALLIGLDASAYYSIPVKVIITQINWFVGNFSLGNQSGFSITGGHEFISNAICAIFCVEFKSVDVSNPFILVNFTIQYPYFEYVNVTIQSPNVNYNGPLDIILGI